MPSINLSNNKNFFWGEHQDLNPGPLGAMQESYPLFYAPPSSQARLECTVYRALRKNPERKNLEQNILERNNPECNNPELKKSRTLYNLELWSRLTSTSPI